MALIAAFKNMKAICEEQLKSQYKIEVFDMLVNPQLFRNEQIIVAPTLIKELPLPLRRVIGDMSNTERVLVGLDLRKVTVK